MSEEDATPPPEPVATGDHWGDPHLEADKDQLVRAQFLDRPTDPPPPDMQTGRVDEGLPAEQGPPVEDLRVAPPAASAWDARPPEEEAASDPPDPDRD
jgi:hypothetical protein